MKSASGPAFVGRSLDRAGWPKAGISRLAVPELR
jgi:hypothetical protein